jgi:hypothetical protein
MFATKSLSLMRREIAQLKKIRKRFPGLDGLVPTVKDIDNMLNSNYKPSKISRDIDKRFK